MLPTPLQLVRAKTRMIESLWWPLRQQRAQFRRSVRRRTPRLTACGGRWRGLDRRRRSHKSGQSRRRAGGACSGGKPKANLLPQRHRHI